MRVRCRGEARAISPLAGRTVNFGARHWKVRETWRHSECECEATATAPSAAASLGRPSPAKRSSKRTRPGALQRDLGETKEAARCFAKAS